MQTKKELEEAIKTLQEYDSGFMKPLTEQSLSGILENLKKPIVHLINTEVGNIGLISLPDGNVKSVRLPYLIGGHTLDDLQRGYLQTYEDFLEAYSDPMQGDTKQRLHAYFDLLDQLCEAFGEAMTTISKALPQGAKHAILVPTGHFSFFPLHAAWKPFKSSLWKRLCNWFNETFRGQKAEDEKRQYLFEGILFSYAPSLHLLGQAEERSTVQEDDSIAAIHSPANSLGEPLKGVEALCKQVAGHFRKNKILSGETATQTNILNALNEASCFHFSWHGIAETNDPLDGSGLMVADGEKLSIRSLLNKDFPKLHLSVLSACETGLRGEILPDEAVSISTSLMAAGSTGVISALWAVPITSTNEMIARFYELWREEKMEPVEALRNAQIELRDGKIKRHDEDGMISCAPRAKKKNKPKDDILPSEVIVEPQTAENTRDKTPADVISELEQSHPFKWAAFNFTGL